MAERAMPEHGSPRDGGFIDHLRSVIAAVTAYFGARLELAGIEAKEALIHFAILAMWVGVALAVIFFGYIFFLIGVILIVAWLLHAPPMWVSLAAGLLHFAFAIVCFLIVRAKIGAPLFQSTINEFKKDQAWLSTPPAPEKLS
jgi:uncharacterized membrane protein YqjE